METIYVKRNQVYIPCKLTAILKYYDRVEYYKNGKLHREDGPAVIYNNGRKEWWVNGRRHREGGPAVEWINGTNQYWTHGRYWGDNPPTLQELSNA